MFKCRHMHMLPEGAEIRYNQKMEASKIKRMWCWIGHSFRRGIINITRETSG